MGSPGDIDASRGGAVDADIIILSLERADDTVGAIASALEQAGVRRHVWVLDQGSSAPTVAALRQFVAGKPEVTLVELDRNLGVAAGRNHLSRLGQGRVIVALDNDAVFVQPDEVARAVGYFDAHADAGAIGFRILNYFTGDDDERSWGYPKSLRPRSAEEMATVTFVGAGHAIRRSAFEEVGGYDDTLFFCWEEADLCFRLINRGYAVRYVPSVRIYHKVSPEQRVNWAGSRYFFFVRNRLYVLFKYGASPLTLGAHAAGYLAKGWYNGAGRQSLRALAAVPAMCRRFRRSATDRALYDLSPAARRYFRENDRRHRGSLLRRLRTEVFARLPAPAVLSRAGR